MLKEDIRELPSEEEVWEVPEPPKPDIKLERGTEGVHFRQYITALTPRPFNFSQKK